METYNYFSMKKSINILKYYIFDWDDNILKMNSILHYLKKVDNKYIPVNVSTEEFAKIKNSPDYSVIWKATEKTFNEFRDFGPRGKKAFIEDVKTAIKNKKFGPSWHMLLEVLISGKLFAIITTRGHEPDTIKNVIEHIIDTQLSTEDKNKMIQNLKNFANMFNVNIKDSDLVEEYLNKCYFMGTTSKAFENQFGFTPVGNEQLNKAKKIAIEYFTNYIRKYAKQLNKKFKVGFSDDDIGYINVVRNLFIDMENTLNTLGQYYVYDTSDFNLKGGKKIKIEK